MKCPSSSNMRIVQIGFIVNHPMTHHVIENRERERVTERYRRKHSFGYHSASNLSFVRFQNGGLLQYELSKQCRQTKTHQSHINPMFIASSNFRSLLLLLIRFAALLPPKEGPGRHEPHGPHVQTTLREDLLHHPGFRRISENGRPLDR